MFLICLVLPWCFCFHHLSIPVAQRSWLWSSSWSSHHGGDKGSELKTHVFSNFCILLFLLVQFIHFILLILTYSWLKIFYSFYLFLLSFLFTCYFGIYAKAWQWMLCASGRWWSLSWLRLLHLLGLGWLVFVTVCAGGGCYFICKHFGVTVFKICGLWTSILNIYLYRTLVSVTSIIILHHQNNCAQVNNFAKETKVCLIQCNPFSLSDCYSLSVVALL